MMIKWQIAMSYLSLSQEYWKLIGLHINLPSLMNFDGIVFLLL